MTLGRRGWASRASRPSVMVLSWCVDLMAKCSLKSVEHAIISFQIHRVVDEIVFTLEPLFNDDNPFIPICHMDLFSSLPPVVSHNPQCQSIPCLKPLSMMRSSSMVQMRAAQTKTGPQLRLPNRIAFWTGFPVLCHAPGLSSK